MFVKANKNLLGNYKDTSLVNYGIYYGRKKFYDTGPWSNRLECLCLSRLFSLAVRSRAKMILRCQYWLNTRVSLLTFPKKIRPG